MFDYLQQFNNLPKDLRDQVSSPLAMATISELEKKYQVDLAMIVMKVMIKSLAVKNLASYLSSEFSLTAEKSASLAQELKEKLFAGVAEYLGLVSEIRALDLDKDINILIKEAGLTIPSANLVSRFKNILATYLKGIRSKIDARASLAKDIKIGGLNLSPAEIDRVFKVCDKQEFKSLEINTSPTQPVAASSRLNEIINQSEKKTPVAEYDLKQALATGQVKPISGAIQPATKLDTKHELAQPAKQLNLPPSDSSPNLPLASSLKPTSPSPVSTPKPVVPATPLKKAVVSPSPVPTGQMAASIRRPDNIAPAPAPAAVSNASVQRPSSTAAARPAPAPVANRPQMHDIKPVPKVMGPAEELRFLDLANFRRLGQTASEAAAKILAKIKLLEKDGYDKMVSGVQAWRQGTVNRLYLRLGQESIVKGVALKDIIDARQKAGQDCLTMEEIEAIVSLNSKLIF
ncbi:MAG: hypothetical protein WC905_01970 [Patescibacteria group bacterium]|jgi:hypothetical protein